MSIQLFTIRRFAVAALAGSALILGACGGIPKEPGSSGSADTTMTKVKDEYAKYAAMKEPERTKALVKAAKAEGALNVYGTNDMVDIGDLFTKKYGIKITMYEGDTDAIATRIAQEADGGRYKADVLNASDILANKLQEEDLLGHYESPTRALVPAEGKGKFWTAYRRQPFIASYNTDEIDPSEIPSDYLDFADPKWKGKISMELGDYDWYMGMVMYYLDKGMSREDIDAKFTQIAKNARIADGHSDQMGLLGAGQFAVSLSSFIHHLNQLADDGAPVAWRAKDGHAVQPIIMRYEAVALTSHAEHPAAATLFMDFVLGQGGTDSSLDRGTLPAIPEKNDPLDGLTVVPLDPEEDATNGATWAKDYDKLLRNSQR